MYGGGEARDACARRGRPQVVREFVATSPSAVDLPSHPVEVFFADDWNTRQQVPDSLTIKLSLLANRSWCCADREISGKTPLLGDLTCLGCDAFCCKTMEEIVRKLMDGDTRDLNLADYAPLLPNLLAYSSTSEDDSLQFMVLGNSGNAILSLTVRQI